MSGSKFSNGLKNNCFAVSFMHLELRKVCKGRLHGGGRKQVEDWIIRQDYSLKGGYILERGVWKEAF